MDQILNTRPTEVVSASQTSNPESCGSITYTPQKSGGGGQQPSGGGQQPSGGGLLSGLPNFVVALLGLGAVGALAVFYLYG